MGKKLLIALGFAVIGGFLIYGGVDAAFLHPLSANALAANAARGEPSELLIAPTLMIFGVVAVMAALKIIGPDTSFDDGYFWAYGARGIPLILTSLVGLLLPLLFLWQLWILFTRDLFRGIPPIAWGRIGGVTSDWVIFACLLFIPWMLAALAGIIAPPVLFWKGLKK